MVEHVSGMAVLSQLAAKSEASDLMIPILRWSGTQTGNRFMELQVNGAGEYIGKHTDIFKFCESEGIQYRITVRHTPQSNGVAEAHIKIHTETGVTL